MINLSPEKKELYLKFINENRLEKMVNIINNRTNKLTVIIENVGKPHNTSAIMRSAEAFGLSTIHVIEGQIMFKRSKLITKGSDKWLNALRYKDTNTAFDKLHKKGYKIFYGDATPTNPALHDIKISQDDKIALVFGQELLGISDYVKENADGAFRIPMHGFVESFNVSVAAAISIYELSKKFREIGNWELDEKEQLDLLEYWMRRHTDYKHYNTSD